MNTAIDPLLREIWDAEYARARDMGFEQPKAAHIAGEEVLRIRATRAWIATGNNSHDPEKRRLIADAWKHRPAGLPDPIQAALKASPGNAQSAYARAYTERREFDKRREAFEPRQREADAQFLEDCVEMTGDAIAPDKAQKQRRERKTLEAQSFEIAEKMREAGVDMFRPDNCRFWRYFIHTKHWEPLIQYRRCTFIPSVSAMVRAPILAALEYFLQRHRYCRFWTFTSGPRVATEGLKARIAALHSRLNELNKELRARYGVEFILRSTENGTPEFDADGNGISENEAGRIEFDSDGNPLWHVHAHVVVYSAVGYIKPEKWAEMYKFIGTFWGYHWDGGGKGNGVIKNARECVKYMTKPADILSLTGAQMRGLYEATTRMKMVHPLGALKTEIRNRKAARRTLRRYRNRNGQTLWRERLDHNKQPETHPDERDSWAGFSDAVDMERETRLAAKTAPGTPLVALMNAPFCRVTARLAPAMGPENFKEPSVLVMGTHRDERAVKNHPLTQSLW